MEYENLRGKKLLILGGSADDCQIVETAQKMGVYTIVSDNHLDWSRSPAKTAADEGWDISWADVDLLKEKALERGVDGVMAGYDERRVSCAIKLSRALGMPFYAEDESVLQKTYDKQLFKDICRENGVPVTKDYFRKDVGFDEWAKDVIYPVLVKPIDRGGSNGIRTCNNEEELKEGIQYALSFSKADTVVVEELIRNGHEVIAYYTFSGGEVALSAMCDKYERKVSDGFNSLPDAYLYPSRHIQEYVEKHNTDVINTLKKMGMKEGSANLQGFYTDDGRFVFFEMDFRVGGTNTYHFTDYFSGENYLKLLIRYSLTGETEKENIERADPWFSGKYGCIFTLLSKDGVITRMEGEDVVRSWSNILYTCFYHRIGTKIEVNGSQYPKTFRAYIVGDSIEQIKDTILKIQDVIHVEDENGENMLFEPFDVSKLDIYK